MEQVRQRVAATCHIGPLDVDETKSYIEHRLKCAGATDKPSFDPTAFEGIYKASGGIPRKINSVCDRLLLLGFLSNRSHLTAEDVAEVAKEFAQEQFVPVRAEAGASVSDEGGVAASTLAELDVDLSKLKLDVHDAETMNRQIVALTTDQRADQLQRLERSLLRLERINVQPLAMLQKLVNAVKKSPE
jgi:hypothetical protein